MYALAYGVLRIPMLTPGVTYRFAVPVKVSRPACMN
jgi:hypothetical protein